MTKISKNNMLSDKIADALTVKPRADIEDDNVFGTKPKTVSRVELNSDSDDEAAISDFRKRNITLLSELSKKYDGHVVSGQDSDENSSQSEDSDDDTEEKSSQPNTVERLSHIFAKSSESDNDESDGSLESEDYSIIKHQKQEDEDNDDSNDSDDDDEENEGYDISEMAEPIKESFEHMKKQNISEEVRKGNSVRSQLLLWEGLLEMRIHLQKCMNTANQMPMHTTFSDMQSENKDFLLESKNTSTNIAEVLNKLLTLQNILLKQFPETKTISSNKILEVSKTAVKDDSDEEIPSDTDNEEIPSDTEPEDNEINETSPKASPSKPLPNKKRKLENYEKEIATSHKAFKPFRDTTIQKWNEKTRVVSAVNIKNPQTNTILQQINYILSDKEKMTKRTQLKRLDYDIIGYKKVDINEEPDSNPTLNSRKDDDEYIPEIFDDSDFYHQLLRELIECKSADITDPVQLSRQWIALQQMRSKMKRKVDTKATKGRRIKYVVHNKLVNFMAPERDFTKWTDDSKTELYNSLFGKIFENRQM